MKRIVRVIIGSVLLLGFLTLGGGSHWSVEPNTLLIPADVYNDGTTVVHKFTKSVALQRYNDRIFGQFHRAAIAYKKLSETNIAAMVFITDPYMQRVVFSDLTEPWIDAYSQAHVLGVTSDNDENNDNYVNVYVTNGRPARLAALRYHLPTHTLSFWYQISTAADGLWYPTDVALNNNETFSTNTDDYLWVVDTRTNEILMYFPNFQGSQMRYGQFGLGVGQFNQPWAIACGRNPIDGSHTKAQYVVDDAGRRVVQVTGGGWALTPLQWVREFRSDTSYISDIVVDSYGQLWIADEGNRIIKLHPADFSVLGTFGEFGVVGDGKFNRPLALGHPEGKEGWADLFVGEEWGDNSGLQRYNFGVDVKDLQSTISGTRDDLTQRLGFQIYSE